MLKLGIELKEAGETMNIRLVDPTKKQLDSASENEKILAQVIKEMLDKKLLDLISEYENKEK